MSSARKSTYINPSLLPYLFCPGCGHNTIVDYLDQALIELQLDPTQVVIVTDIGCSGLSDKYFITNTFHGLHGRSITYATGIKLANPDLKVIVLMGDGGCGIGGHHLLNAARRNIGLTVVVFNNFNYGMTGGEHSVTTPMGSRTSTTPFGQLERPLDICRTVAVNGASFTARTTTFDKNLPHLLASAIRNEGFSVVDIWELCTAYYVPNNHFSKKALLDTLSNIGFETGIIVDKLISSETRPEYSRAYRDAWSDEAGKPAGQVKPLLPKYSSSLDRETHLVIAGAAGAKINTAASAFCQGAILSGLQATQRNDYPVTVKSGHSNSEVIISPTEIHFTGITQIEFMLVLLKEGLAKVREQIRRMGPAGAIYIHPDLLPVETSARVIPLDFLKSSSFQSKKEYWAMGAFVKLLFDNSLYPLEAYKEAVSSNPRFVAENLAAIESVERIIEQGQRADSATV